MLGRTLGQNRQQQEVWEEKEQENLLTDFFGNITHLGLCTKLGSLRGKQLF